MTRVRTAAESFFARRSAAGMVFAALAYQQSLTPSLLPRGWVAQGAVSGLSVVLVYLLVTGLVRLGAALGLTPVTVSDHLPEVRRWTGWGAVLALPVFLAFSIPGRQTEWQALGYDVGDRLGYVGVLVVAVVVLLVAALVVWGCRALYARVLRGVRVVVPLGIASAVAVVATGLVVVLAVNELAYSRFMDAMNSSREGADSDVGEVAPPADAAVSGSPASLVTWASLGRDGRSFIQRRPSAAAITEIAPTAAIDPIRIFIGRQAADTHAERAALALAELERTEAFAREVLMLVAPTGAGWVDEQVVQPVEYFYAGDTATVAVQYSHLPSPIAFLSEQDAAIESSRALYDAVTGRLAAMPEADRPLFLVTGESLGAFGGTGVFDNLDALVRRV
ncbi:alpha/beta-hydrolase family protein, partial [Nocardioides sp.]|uniref:alpha/beta-hydrolase family protein n=1 Tax=Nocardioides sp. TaxID=35761 RepID=UPI00273522CD